MARARAQAAGLKSRASGTLAGRVWSDAQFDAAERLLKAVTEQGLETVRLVFADQHGVTRGKTLVAGALESVLLKGVAMTSTLLLKDTSHRTVFPVWEDDAGFGSGVMTGASDFLMLPDPETFRALPWAAGTGWLLSDLYLASGEEIALSTRRILRRALARLKERDMALVAGLEVEFTVLAIDDARLDHAASDWQEQPPATSLLTHGYQHLTENRGDQLFEVSEMLRAHAHALGLPLRSIEAEFGPSQLEFVFEPMDGLAAADAMLLFRNMVKQSCARKGLHATFMCRPGFRNAMGSGWHLHQSLVDTGSGRNLFTPAPGEKLTETGGQWIAGLLEHAASACLMTTPTVNGYKRYQPFALAPDRIQWGRDNRGAMLRALMLEGDSASRVENRVGEPAANPYLYIASQVLAGLDGLERGLKPPVAVERPYGDSAEMLPTDLGSAIVAFEQSPFWREVLGTDFVDYLCRIKRAEWARYLAAVSEWEQREYFTTF